MTADRFALMVLPPQSAQSQAVAKAVKFNKGLYAARPGTGPEGETCKSCKHLTRKVMSRAYLKCDLVSAHWTGGGGTDVKAGAPACSKWRAIEKDEQQ